MTNIKKLWKKFNKEWDIRDEKFIKKYKKKRFVLIGISFYIALVLMDLIQEVSGFNNIFFSVGFATVFCLVIYYKNIYDISFNINKIKKEDEII